MGKLFEKWSERHVKAAAKNKDDKVQEHKGKIYIFPKGQKKPIIFDNWGEALENGNQFDINN